MVQELQGERIDIVPWSPDPAKYVYNALAPAKVSMAIVDEDAKTILAVVPDDQLSLAIGRQGQNVRLAARLLGWRIDVKSEQRYANLEDEGYQSLLQIKGVEEALADQIYSRDICNVNQLARAAADDLTVLRAIDDEQAQYLIESAAAIVAAGGGIDEEQVPENVESETAEVPVSEDVLVAEDVVADEGGQVDPVDDVTANPDAPAEGDEGDDDEGAQQEQEKS